jgi:sterol desaturase/sphingolipid hydroxylase (fatty acid hydroxylase superfamily)
MLSTDNYPADQQRLERKTTMTIENWTNILGIGGSAIFIVEVGRRLIRRAMSKKYLGEVFANLSTLPMVTLTAAASTSLWFWVASGATAVLPWSIPTNWFTAIAAFVLVDFLYYWEHRISHEWRPLWALGHSVHHSSPVYDISVAARISFVDSFTFVIFYLPAVILGFSPLLVLACLGLTLAYQTWIHTELIGKLGWFDRWFNSPSNHRVHHGSNPGYLDCNYGSMLMVWDRMFRTWVPETEKVIYGLTTPINSINPWKVHTFELGRLIRERRATKELVS